MSVEINLAGSYEISLDSKGRFLMPLKYREQLPDGHKEEFVVTIEFEKCLKIYPKIEFIKKNKEFDAYDQIDRDVDRLRRAFNKHADIVTLDAAGRLNISNKLMEKVGLKFNSKIQTLAYTYAFEVWDVDVYKQYDEEEEELKTIKAQVKKAHQENSSKTIQS
jgi:MraZ protein